MGHSIPATSLVAARVSFAAAATFVVLLGALHATEPEFDPSWHFISEYALGPYGWMMVSAFFSLAVGFVALVIAIQAQLPTVVGRIGLGLLLVSAVGLAMGGIFTTDPITTSRDALTTHGKLHGFGFALGMAMPFATALVSWKLAKSPAWSTARRSLLWTAGVAVTGNVAFIVFMITAVPSDGKFGPNVLIGWPNRLEILAYCAWVMVVAWYAARLKTRVVTTATAQVRVGRKPAVI